MTLKEYLENLNNAVALDSSLLDLEVVYSQDEEGNSYQKIFFTPGIMYFDEDMEPVEEEENDTAIKMMCMN